MTTTKKSSRKGIRKILIEKISKETGFDRTIVRKIVYLFLDGIQDTLLQRSRVELRGFGVFSFRLRKAMMMSNPKTGERFTFPASLRVAFKPGRAFTKTIEQRFLRRVLGGA